jgi:hypothetical protein
MLLLLQGNLLNYSFQHLQNDISKQTGRFERELVSGWSKMRQRAGAFWSE